MTVSYATRAGYAVIAAVAIVAIVAAVLVLRGGGSAAPAAQSELLPDDAVIVARVDGDAILENDMIVAAQEFREQMARIPPNAQRQALLDLVIDIHLMAGAARAEAIDADPAVARRLALAEDRALRAEYLRVHVFEGVTEDAIQQTFDEELAAFVSGEELETRHILVATEAEAKAIIDQLAAGGDFATLARENSLDGSASRGGALGFLARGETVPPFEEAMFALEPGAYTTMPVQSQFGWHIIMLDSKREQQPPTMAARQGEIRNELLQERFVTTLEALRAAATIDIVEPEPPPPEAAGMPADGDAPAR